jgi:hypothetical protein
MEKTSGKIVSEFVKPNTVKFENDLRESIGDYLKDDNLFPTDKEVFVSIVHGIHAEKEYGKCDLDNRAKCILDALKKVVYLDDSQVKILWTEKLFLKNEQESYFSICVKILDAASYKKLSMLTNNIIKI